VRILIKGCLVLLGATFCFMVQANDYSDWHQIEQPMFTVIFQPEQEGEARRVASLLNQYISLHLAEMPIEVSFKPIPIVLLSQAHTSNGFVGMSPYRSHWYNKPSSFAGLEWYDTLAVHEGRHIAQYNQFFDHSTGKILGFLFGENGASAFSHFFVPTWFFEGDAVAAETSMTDGGRGRVASFDLWFRTDTLTQPFYSYERAMLGTGFDRVPYLSPYVLGYFFTSYLRQEFGTDLFDRVLKNTGTFNALNFNTAVKGETRANLKTLYEAMMLQLKGSWQLQQAHLSISDVITVHPAPVDYWASLYPIGFIDKQVVAVEIDPKQGSAVVAVDDASKEHLVDISNSVTQSFLSGAKARSAFVAGSEVCWVIEKEHATKPNQQTANLECSQKNQDPRTLVSERKLTLAAYGENQFLVHEFNTDRTSVLTLVDINGNTLRQIPLPDRSLVSDLNATETGGWVFVMQGDDHQGIYHLNADLTDLTLLKKAENETLRSPVLTDHWLLYTSDFTGIDQVMAASRYTGDEYQILTRPYGSYFLNYRPYAEQIVLADYTPTGQQIISVDFSDHPEPESNWQLKKQLTEKKVLADFQPPSGTLVQLNPVTEPVQPYSITSNLWNPHSRFLQYDGTTLSAGVVSTDIFETLNVAASVGYNQTHSDWVGAVDVQYRLPSAIRLSGGVKKAHLNSGDSYSLLSALTSIRFQSGDGLSQQVANPVIGLTQYNMEDGEVLSFLIGQMTYTNIQQSALQAIQTPLGLKQEATARVQIENHSLSFLTDSLIALPGLSSRQSSIFNMQLQYLEQNAFSLLPANAIFPAVDDEGLSARVNADYHWNLGPVGLPLTPLVYWRNTAVLFNARSQFMDDTVAMAFGVTVKPNLNLFRNGLIEASPSVSFYYRPEIDTWQVAMSFIISD